MSINKEDGFHMRAVCPKGGPDIEIPQDLAEGIRIQIAGHVATTTLLIANNRNTTVGDTLLQTIIPTAMNRMGSFQNQIEFLRELLWIAGTGGPWGQYRPNDPKIPYKCKCGEEGCLCVECTDFSGFEREENLPPGTVHRYLHNKIGNLRACAMEWSEDI